MSVEIESPQDEAGCKEFVAFFDRVYEDRPVRVRAGRREVRSSPHPNARETPGRVGQRRRLAPTSRAPRPKTRAALGSGMGLAPSVPKSGSTFDTDTI